MGSVPFSRLQCIQNDKPSIPEELLCKMYGLETGTVGESSEKLLGTTMSGFEVELDYLIQHLCGIVCNAIKCFKPIIVIKY